MVGWETGRDSEPAFMNMNLHALRGDSTPKVVLMQHDSIEPMNPRGLLVAYAETYVKPVVSDFDTFTVGSKGMEYGHLPNNQIKLMQWLVHNTEQLMHVHAETPFSNWTSAWLKVLKMEAEAGFNPKVPKFGFGDQVSYDLIEKIVGVTAPVGAVWHQGHTRGRSLQRETGATKWGNAPDHSSRPRRETQTKR